MDTQASSFYGHVTLGLRIHFSYLSQPSVFKICSFINLCIHPSLIWVFGKIFIAFTLQVHTHFFFQKLVMISESFFSLKEKLEVISFQKRVGFLAERYIFSLHYFFPFLSYYHLFISFFFLFLFEQVMRTRAHTTCLRPTTR